MVSVDIISMPLAHVVEATRVDSSRPTRASFLNLRFKARRSSERTVLAGPGIYGITYRFRAKEPMQAGLIYVGMYRGTRGNPFGGDVVRTRWWAHAASFTMRGYRVHIAQATVQTLASQLGMGRHDFGELLGLHADVTKDRGNGAGLNRVLFALKHWNEFSRASAEEVLNRFEVIYARLRPEGIGLSETVIRSRLRLVEDCLKEKLRPICNSEIEWNPKAPLATAAAFRESALAELKSAMSAGA